jgi:hypothetical protein
MKKSWTKKSWSCMALLATGLSIAYFGPAAHASSAAPDCAWGQSSLLTNAAWPDTHANYWITPFTAESDLKITVRGAYPNARYFSLTAYNAWGLSTEANVIHDSQIAPQADGSFSVTVDHLPGPNRILFANAFNGTRGYLALRIYLANGNVSLPSVTFTTNAGSVTLGTCPSYTPPDYVGIFNNPDNTFVEMYPQPPTVRTVTVISGKAPTQVRYWSYCTYLWTSAVVDCRYDGDTLLTNGYYHIVLGQPSQKNAIASDGYTYLHYAGMVMLRNLLANQTTGAYAPVVKTCALTDRTCIAG